MYTFGQVVERLNVKEHRVRYAIERLRLKPAARASTWRLFDDRQLQAIGDELNRIEARRRQTATTDVANA
ncbi:MAG: MerR family transcriptional regulator [Planctomycetes bacterium]|nr:MerR family transcriptional regulator [Planctomycetota bacterium]